VKTRRLPLIVFLLTVLPAAAGAAPQRVVSLAPNLTEMVTALGGDDRLAAVTPFCQAPEGVVRLPGGMQPEAEAVLGLGPDLVLATPMTPAKTRRQLGELGLRVEVVETDSLAGIRTGLERVAALLGRPVPPQADFAPASRRRTAVLLFGAETGYSAGGGTHAHEILEAAGLHNLAAAAGGPWPQLGEEFLLAADPEIVVVADYGSSGREDILRQWRAHPVRRHWQAVQAGHVVVFPAAALTVPGPAALRAAEELRAEVDPW